MTEKEKKTVSKTPRRHYVLFWMIVVILLAFLKSWSDGLKTNEQKADEYRAQLQALEEAKENAVPQEYLNALKRWKIYYWMWFSKQKVYDQLISDAEKFTAEEAQYAIDNL